MRYLIEDKVDELLDTVRILSISDDEVGDISQYFFDSGEADEYVSFLKNDALELDEMCISKTYVMFHRKTGELIGYFTLSTDTVRLTADEKSEIELGNIQFMSLPAIKVGKLAINKSLSSDARQKGYGSLALEIANAYAYRVIETGVACRFLTVDADIEYDKNTPLFYEKNGFTYNLSRKRKVTDKTVSMRRDIFA